MNNNNNNIGIYCIRNIKNNKMYIGQSTRLEKRFNEHFKMLKNGIHHSIKLQRAYDKVDNKNIFQFEILEFVENEYELDVLEQHYIDFYDSYFNGYNCTSASNYIPKQKLNEDFLRFNYKRFLKINIDELEYWLTGLTFIEKAFILSIMPFVEYDDCSLKHKNGKSMNIQDIIRITNIPKTTVYNVIVSLGKKNILYKYKRNKQLKIFINPWILCKGNKIDNVLKDIFRNYKIKSLKNTKWKSIK